MSRGRDARERRWPERLFAEGQSGDRRSREQAEGATAGFVPRLVSDVTPAPLQP